MERVVNVKQVAMLLSKHQPVMSRENAYKWLRRRNIEPAAVAPLPIGRLYLESEILAARDEWYAERGRETDRKRSESAIARRT